MLRPRQNKGPRTGSQLFVARQLGHLFSLSPQHTIASDPALLAVDLGLRTGFAFYGRDGRLLSYRSQNLGSRSRLKRAASSMLHQAQGVERLILEGGGDLAEVWVREGERRDMSVRVIGAERWRKALLLPREQRHGADAKAAADGLARAVIAWSGAKAPTGALRHDVAEAIAIGLWGVLEARWLNEIPEPIRHR
ncbi:MAG: hypothetical protein AAF170_09815 [Bacteroidota bacterium]